MNKRVITLLTGALLAGNEDNNVEALRQAAEAVAELSLLILDEAEAMAAKVAPKTPKLSLEKSPNRGENGTPATPRYGARRRHAPKVQAETRALIWERFQGGETPSNLAKAFGLGKSTVGNILAKKKKELGLPLRPAYFGGERTRTTA